MNTIPIKQHSNDISVKGRSLSRDAFDRLLKNKLAMTGLIILIFMIVVAIITPWIAPYSYDEQDLALGVSPPSKDHWLGTDIYGRDLLTRLMYGSRISLMVGFIATTVALTIGVLWGAIAGFIGGKLDALMMRFVDALYALPFTIFIILLAVIFGSNIVLLFIAIGAVEWLTMARIVRGQVLTVRKQEFIEAAIAMGLSSRQIIWRHVIPNVIGPIIIYITLTIPGIILLESSLSFLGLGVQAPMSSWGNMISSGVEAMDDYPWVLIFPALTLSITLFALNFLGDGLRDALDPKGAKD
jgi:oligopeptide transport system permease protein